MTGTVFFHIGFPKTSTTTLQDILIQHSQCHYIGKGLREGMAENTSLELTKALIFATPSRSGPLIEKMAATFAAQRKTAPCLCASDEAYSFAEFMLIGPRWQRQVVTDHAEMAQRMYAICPDAHIVMSFRNQLGFLKSFYRQRSKTPGFKTSFHDYLQVEIDRYDYRSMLHLIEYDRCLEAYRNHFGPERVHVYFYEEIVADYAAYVREMMRLMQIDAEEGLRHWGGRHLNERRVRTRLDFLRDGLPTPVRKLVPTAVVTQVREIFAVPEEEEVTWSPDQRAFCIDCFAPSNRRLAEMTGADVARLGYPV